MLDRERQEVAAAARRLAAAGLVRGSSGNLSVRAGDSVAVTPTGARLAELRTEQVSVVGLDGGVRGGAGEPTSELELHLAIYRRYGAGAVVHTHAPFATALSCVLEELPCVHYELLALGDSVRVARYEAYGTAALAAAVLDALEDRAAALMSNHGTVSHGPDLEVAVERTELLEWGCALYWRAAALGEPRLLDEGRREAVAESIRRRGYGLSGR